MCIYVYICVYMCICIFLYHDTKWYMSTYVLMNICLYVCMAGMYTCIFLYYVTHYCISTYVMMKICLYVSMARTYIYVRENSYTMLLSMGFLQMS